jgi:uncharacterized protein YllA (UPF0747 family)
MQEDPTLTQAKVAKRLGKGKDYVGRLLMALSRARDTGTFEVDWKNYGRNRDEIGAKKVAREQPDAFVDAFNAAPPAAKRKIAAGISRAPEVRAEARKRDTEAETKRKPSPVKPRVDHTLYEFEARLVSARRNLREALALVDGIDNPGDDEDIIELIAMLRQMIDAVDETYRSGKSLDTWAWELYERSAEA